MLSLNNSTGEYEVVDIEQFENVVIEDMIIEDVKDKTTQLAEGLSTATTISQIRNVAKSIIEVETK